VRVRLAVRPPPQVDDGPPAAELRRTVDDDVPVRGLDIPGRNACARATASWIGEPSKPYVRAWYWWK
jgi:hypothetical protein